MKKNIVIILSVILISLVITTLYQTFATDSGVSNSNNVYNISLTDSNTVSVPAYNSKTILYQIVNTNKGTVKYGVAYNADTDINVSVYDNSSDSHIGLFDYGEYKYVKLRLYNDTDTEKEVSLKTVLGYENGGDLIIPSGYELVDDTYISANYLKYSAPSTSSAAAATNFLSSTLPLTRSSIEKIDVTSKQPDSSSLGAQDVSINQNGSIMLWYTDSDSNDLYEVYLTTDDERLHLTGDLNFIFHNLTNLKELNVETFDTSLVTSMYSMFRECNSLINLDVSGFDTSSVTSMYAMFNGCLSLTELDVSNFDTSKVTNMARMFYECSKLIKLDVSGFDTSKNTNFVYAFFNCSSLTNLDVSNFETANVTTMGSMFRGCSSLTELDVSNFDTSKVTAMFSMFQGCTSLTILDVSNFDTSNVTSMDNMFNDCSGLTVLNVSNFVTESVTDMSFMFRNCKGLTNLDVSNFDTSDVTSMAHMFYGCSKLTSLNLSNWNVSSNTSFAYTFFECTSIEELDVSSFYAPKVTTMLRMFSEMTSLKTLKTVNTEKGTRFETKIVSTMRKMFNNCRSLISVDLSGIYTSNLTDVEGVFGVCGALTSADIRNIDFSSVTTFANMFDKSDPTSVNITINSSQQTWFNTNFPAYTNLTLVNS